MSDLQTAVKAIGKGAGLHGTLIVSGGDGTYAKLHVCSTGHVNATVERTIGQNYDAEAHKEQWSKIAELCRALEATLKGGA